MFYKEANGVAIKNEIGTGLSRQVSMGAMHTALVRLGNKAISNPFMANVLKKELEARWYSQITALG